ncbi:Patched domain-containing protein 3 [Toxocara canis]|uniref:Patched domain-containing protein 3 n=1 Tax=Toxocara canis TaxID=6265 RepID=A0A0B2VK49_TOXCA|nr:Patched domain-containing protein 3 [Toxocara canis]
MGAQCNTSQPTLFIRLLTIFFRITGHLVAKHPILVIIVLTLITIVFSMQVPLTKMKDDLVTGFTPSGARAFVEIEAYRKFNNGHYPLLIFILAIAKDGGSMLRLSHLNATVDIIDNIGSGFAIKNITFNDICENFCDINEPVRQFRNGLLMSAGNGDSSVVELSFPLSRFIGRELDMSANLFGVTTFERSEMSNNSGSNIKDLRLVLLQFRAQRPLSWNTDDASEWERKVTHYYLFSYKSSFIKPMVYSLVFAQDEIARTGRTMFPYIAIGLLMISIFSLVTVYIGAAFTNQWSIHKVTFAITASICPLLATSTSLGLLFCLGVRFSSILCITPFLALSIGVDDSYLLINAWNHICVRQKDLAVRSSLEERIVEMFVDVGPSMTITSLTNMLAFAIGVFTPIAEIRILCMAASTAIFFSFIYTITLYAAIMTLGAKREIANEKNATKTAEKPTHSECSNFLNGYCEWLSTSYTSALMLLILCLYWYASIRGSLSAEARLSINKLFMKGSPMLEVNAARERYVLPSYTHATIFVNEAGNLSDASRVAKIKAMVNEFEQLPECNGPQFSHFWIRDYEMFVGDATEDYDLETGALTSSTSFLPQDIRRFLAWPEYKYWGGFIRFDNITDRMESFFITVAYHGKHLAEWTQRLNILKRWRAIVDRYPELKATVYEDEALYSDQIDRLVPTTIQTSLATLACMAVVCCIFMSNLFTVLIAVGSITSICLGVFGFLSFWGIDVDAFSMAAIIMSIGLSVDFPAHITYHYYRTGYDTTLSSVEARMSHSLSAIGFPLLQCSGSTILFVLCLLFIPCYMSEVFIKTIVLVISLGIVHALVVVPALLCALSNIYQLHSTWHHSNKVAISNVTTECVMKGTVSTSGIQPVV